MLIKQLNRTDAEKVFISVQNVAGETLSVGMFVCYDWANATSHGNAVAKPATSNLTLFAGAVCGRGLRAYTDLGVNSHGIVQAWGVMGSCTYNLATTSVSCAGQPLLPLNGLYSGQGDTRISGVGLSWTSEALMVARGAFLMTNDLSATGWADAFIRAL